MALPQPGLAAPDVQGAGDQHKAKVLAGGTVSSANSDSFMKRQTAHIPLEASGTDAKRRLPRAARGPAMGFTTMMGRC